MNITNEVCEKLGLTPVPEYVTEGPWKMFDDGSAEVEVLEFLYALVRLMKPQEVLETGSYLGLSGAYLGLGLRDNGTDGRLDSIEWTKDRLDEAKKKWKILELTNIAPHYMSSLEFKPTKQYDLVLLDTEPQTRFKELDYYWDHIKPGGIIVIHDLSQDLGTGNSVWEDVNLIEEKIRSHQLTAIHFYTPRGLTLLRKFNDTINRPDHIYKLLNE